MSQNEKQSKSKKKVKQILKNGIYTLSHHHDQRWCLSIQEISKKFVWEKNNQLQRQQFFVYYDKNEEHYIIVGMNGMIVSYEFFSHSNEMENKTICHWNIIKEDQYIQFQLKEEKQFLSFSRKRDSEFMTLKNEQKDAIKTNFIKQTIENESVDELSYFIEEIKRNEKNNSNEFQFPNEIKHITQMMISIVRTYKQITIPSTVTIIDENSFEYLSNTNIQSIECGEQWISYFLHHSSIHHIIVRQESDNEHEKTTEEKCGNIYIEEDSQFSKKKNVICHPKYFKYFKDIPVSEYSIPDSIKVLKYSHFSLGNKSIETITIPKSIEMIDEKTFIDYIHIKKIICESKWINRFNASLITHISVIEGTTFIRKDYFKNCTNLQWLEIPSTMQNIEQSSFSACKQLKEIVSDSKWLLYFENIPIRYYTIHKQSETIQKEHFMKSPQLNQITIPLEIENIEEGAFTTLRRIRKITCHPKWLRYFSDTNFKLLFDKSSISKWYSSTCLFGNSSNCTFSIPEGVTEIHIEDIRLNEMITDMYSTLCIN